MVGIGTPWQITRSGTEAFGTALVGQRVSHHDGFKTVGSYGGMVIILLRKHRDNRHERPKYRTNVTTVPAPNMTAHDD